MTATHRHISLVSVDTLSVSIDECDILKSWEEHQQERSPR